MIEVEMNIKHSVLTIRPVGPLSQHDFVKAAVLVDPLIAKNGDLTGIIIQAESFPGWHDFAALLEHFKFIRDHHQHVKKVAVVSDSSVLTIFPHIAAHFIRAELKHFHFDAYDEAMAWIIVDEEGA
ncbi:STAS/SEC14 domain-containing protein [Mariprofundus sp. EBB-1]|uniref:STAS/SEC14 domain-containing protein n=1 Tax=Mariprofundus sp. EBB-1 TaxID=2650971 RepID=UPI000EF21958|nr:STAS/SEC14 domain-containing protein [Mariprofundus sp. EBB-1]RLL55917.1 STAS/SEC14 domain-containing protein [Mariprofundus sp. EBB-1]